MIFLIHTLTFLGTLVLRTFPLAPYFFSVGVEILEGSTRG